MTPEHGEWLQRATRASVSRWNLRRDAARALREAKRKLKQSSDKEEHAALTRGIQEIERFLEGK